MKKELHCFILWEKSRRLENEIIEDIRKHFKIMKIFEIAWPKEFFADNLSRFYGKKLSKSNKKEKQCGNGKFLFIVVLDEHPKHDELGHNLNMIIAKNNYRIMTGKKDGYLVHGSDCAPEADENMRFVLGIGTEEFAEQNKTVLNNTQYTPFAGSMIAQNGWKNKKQLLDFAKKIPASKLISAKDLIFEAENKGLFVRLINAKKPWLRLCKNRYYVLIKGQKTPIKILQK